MKLALLALALSLGTAAHAQEVVASVDPADTSLETSLDTRLDVLARMTVDVMINGQGPFPFAVDTGADRTAISVGLAKRLNLPADSDVSLNGMAGIDTVGTVRIASLRVGNRHLVDVRAPALPDASLGVMGLLGIDALANHKVVMDFDAEKLTLRPSVPKPEPAVDDDTIVVVAKRRFGQLVLVDASIDGQKVYAIVDSGAQITVGNLALRRMLMRSGQHRKASVPIELISVTGRKLTADLTTMPKIRLGGMDLGNVQVAYSNAHPFKKFGLLKQPALLLGVDVLSSFRRVSLDFESKKVRFLLKGGSGLTEPRQAVAIALPSRHPGR